MTGSQKIGNYEILDVIGHGGMGVVYKAIDNGIGRSVAIKMITRGFEENPDLLRRFYREAQSAGMLQHPNIVSVYELGRHEQNPYLVMEYLEGETLAQVIAANSDYSLVEKLGFIIQACDALQYAHEHGVVHRDVKPANIMVLKSNVVKLLDFGIARLANETMTHVGQMIGTMAYMSPEQLTAEVVDLRSDIFSMSVVAFELLTLTHPFAAKDSPTAMPKILHNPPLPIEALLPECPPELGRILGKGMAKAREDRYTNIGDLGFELARLQETLKRQRINDFVERARALVDKGQFYRAKEILKEVITFDPQNEAARALTDLVQLALQKEQRGRQIQLLRTRAEEAAGQKRFDEALACIDQVMNLDTGNQELVDLRCEWVRAKEAHELATRDLVDKAVRQAQEAMAHGDVEAALAIMVACRSEIGDSTEVRQMLRQLEKERALVAEVAVERAISDVEVLLLGKQYGAIRDVLLHAAKHLPFASVSLQSKLEELKGQVKVEQGAEPLIGYDETILSVSSPEVDATTPPVAVAPVRKSSEQTNSGIPVTPESLPNKQGRISRTSTLLVIGLLAVAFTAYYFNRKPTVLPQTGYVSVSALPWCTVVDLVGSDGKVIPVDKRTPVAVQVPQGQYTIHTTGPNGEQRSDRLSIAGPQTNYRVTFAQVDVEKLLSGY